MFSTKISSRMVFIFVFIWLVGFSPLELGIFVFFGGSGFMLQFPLLLLLFSSVRNYCYFRLSGVFVISVRKMKSMFMPSIY